ncbi:MULTISPECIES: hypothetical protein [Gracilibacillus]|uniref:Uncharacterized protein n=1 Tax=Gracilibacillus thailandensis TaxID=563735 RepID=A0A6N7R5L5_9BACI|nr:MULTISPECIES: hypothetical protein [Gracilibacillus]MRI68505.1 hypothetical protein [Gracilibacillus thailandensis]
MPNDELAKKRWLAIPGDVRKKLESNVFCSNCGETTIVDYEVDSVNHTIILKGYCKKCNGEVARVID